MFKVRQVLQRLSRFVILKSSQDTISMTGEGFGKKTWSGYVEVPLVMLAEDVLKCVMHPMHLIVRHLLYSRNRVLVSFSSHQFIHCKSSWRQSIPQPCLLRLARPPPPPHQLPNQSPSRHQIMPQYRPHHGPFSSFSSSVSHSYTPCSS